jgi:hypothetical protein
MSGMWILLLPPFALLALSQLLALVALAQAAPATGLGLPALAVPSVVYLAASLLSLSALVLAALPARVGDPGPRAPLIALAVLAGLLVCAAPLLWGRTIGEFHLSHHLVRALVTTACLVLYSWYVASHR